MKKNKTVLIIVSLFVVALLMMVAFLLMRSKPDTTNRQRAEEIKSSQPIKNSSQDDTNLPKNAISTTNDTVPVSADLSVSIDTVVQQNRTLTIKATTSSSGTCVFQFTTENDKPVISQAQVVENTCTAAIPEVQFSRLGTWQLRVTYYRDGNKTEARQDVTIQ